MPQLNTEMTPDEIKLLNFITHLPSDLNPYLAIAKKIESDLHLAAFPTWVLVLQRCAIAGFTVVFIQSLYLIHLRIQARAFTFGKLLPFGMFRLDIPSSLAIAYALFSPLFVADLVWSEFVNDGNNDMAGKIILSGSKFLVALSVSWIFLWTCACQCVSIIYECRYGEEYTSGRRFIHPVISYFLNVVFIMMLLLPIPGVFHCLVGVNVEYATIKHITKDVIRTLHHLAPQYEPSTSSLETLLSYAMPAAQVTSHFHTMAHLIGVSMIIYISVLIFFVALYVPLLGFSIGTLYLGCTPRKKLQTVLQELGHDRKYEISMMSRKMRRQRARLVFHAFMTFFSTLLHIPVIVLLLRFDGDHFFQNLDWRITASVGLHFPLSITANISIFVLILHSHYQLEECRTRGSTMKPAFDMPPDHLTCDSISSYSEKHTTTTDYETDLSSKLNYQLDPSSTEEDGQYQISKSPSTKKKENKIFSFFAKMYKS